MPIGLAILGSGIFVREEHLPAVLANPSLELKAVYSRSSASAKKLLEGASLSNIAIYSDNSSDDLNSLLARSDISAVIIALPIIVQLSIVKRCLDAGKHVLSEKPVGPTVASAKELIKHCASLSSRPQWSIAEQFRVLGRFNYAAEQVKSLGQVQSFRLRLSAMVKPGAKYYETEWRKTPEHQGGFLLDGGVHFIAGIRLILGKDAAMKEVTGYGMLSQKHLPPVDSIVAAVRLKNGGIGTIDMSFGTTGEGVEFVVCCENGRVECDRTVAIVRDGRRETKSFESAGSGVPDEVQLWANGIDQGQGDPRISPQAALGDLEVLEAIFNSDGKAVKLVEQDE